MQDDMKRLEQDAQENDQGVDCRYCLGEAYAQGGDYLVFECADCGASWFKGNVT